MCYRESADENGEAVALEAFAREVEEAGRMTEERREMFDKLTEKESSNSKEKSCAKTDEQNQENSNNQPVSRIESKIET